MNRRNNRNGKMLRSALLVLTGLLVLPTLMLVVWFNARANAQEAEQQRDRAFRSQQRAKEAVRRFDQQPVLPLSPTETAPRSQATVYRQVPATQVQKEEYTVTAPRWDPQTGRVVQSRQYAGQVPQEAYRISQLPSMTRDPKITLLISQLRMKNVDDESRESMLKELRQRLEMEFIQMHENQSKEIVQTGERLEALKKLHQERGQNKEKIVQRRMDELLGKIDAMKWNSTIPNVLAPPRAIRDQAPYSFPGPAERANTTDLSSTGLRTILITPNRQIAQGQTPVGPKREKANQPNPNWRPGRPATPLTPPNPYATQPDNAAAVNRPSPPLAPQAPTAVRSKVQRSTTYDNPNQITDPVRVSPQPQISVSAFSVGEVFQLARDAATAMADLAEAKEEYERSRGIQEKDAIQLGELRIAELKLGKLKRAVQLNNYQLEAMSESFLRNLKFAKSSLEHATEKLELVDRGFRQGAESTQKRLAAKHEADKARNAVEEANANLSQLKRAMKLIESLNNKADPQQTNDEEDESDKPDESDSPERAEDTPG